MPYIKKKIAYKVVTADYQSPFRSHDRSLGCDESLGAMPSGPRTGRILKYQIGKEVVSPNGLCECDDLCCRGIHAYSSLEKAKLRLSTSNQEFVVELQAEQWWKPRRNEPFLRAEKVKVVRVVEM